MKKGMAFILCFILVTVLILSGCSNSKGTTSGSKDGGDKALVVGVSNGYIGNGWRTQMIEAIELLAEDYKEKGWIEKIIIQHAGLDVNNQIAQIRNMINSNVDLLLIDANSETALNPIIEEAVEKGITVITFDQPVTSDKAFNVVINQQEFGRNLAEWFVDEIGGKGDIVIVSGLAGNSANVNRLIGMNEVLAKYPDIKILTEVNGNWDQANAQQVTSNLIASYPNIDGVLTQDGMALGVINAFEAANKDLPVITGENNVAFLKKWKALKDSKSFSTYGQNNPPGIGATALGIGVRMLQGKQSKLPMDGNTFYYPIGTHITNSNLEEEVTKVSDKPDTYTLDEWLSEEELDSYFE